MTANALDREDISPEDMTTDNFTTDQLLASGIPINLVEEIETVLTSLSQDQKIMVGKGETGNVWKFNYGSVEVFIQLTGETDNDTLTVWSKVLQLPAKNEAELMQKLLIMNWSATFESRFAIVDNQVVVVASRTVADINPSEISRIITVVATIADNNDDILQAEYGY